MLVDPSTSTAGLTVTGAIRQAAQATGTSFQYLLATAQVESGLDPKAGAPTSSARGLFQFVEQTWLGTLKQSGAALGYGQYAAAITKTASGHYQVQDPAMRSAILKLRNDPIANAVMAGAFTQANAALLSAKLGRSPSEGELYIAHFLGAGGAARLISAAASNPNAAAASHFPDAAQANSSIFYDRTTGAARSLARVRDILTARYDVAARGSNETANVAQVLGPPRGIVTIPRFATASVPGGVAAVPAAAGAPTLPAVTPAAAPVAMAPDTAGMTSAFADAAPKRVQQENDIFHGLFADPGRASPVAEVVSQLWGVSGATSPDAGGALLDLFKDDGKSG
jgi:Transglycosylase SLT domain